MTSDQLCTIESALGIVLPEAYKAVISNYPWPQFAGSTEASLWDDSTPIIEQTLEYRDGFGGAPSWPQNIVVVGDEDDACPFALDCKTGRIVKTDHGNLKKAPLQEFDSITEFVSDLRKTYDGLVRKPWWKLW